MRSVEDLRTSRLPPYAAQNSKNEDASVHCILVFYSLFFGLFLAITGAARSTMPNAMAAAATGVESQP